MSRENRGTSMVAKHFQKLQLEKEEAALQKLRGLMPKFGEKVRVAALKESSWVPEKAAVLLSKFQMANSSKLSQLHKKRRKILAALVKSSKPYTGSSPSEGSRPKKKSKHKSKTRKHGFIRESDFYSKRAEFVKWAAEAKKVDIDSCTRAEELKLFSDYVEDYNTGTLPHSKYYDLEAHALKKEKKQSKRKKEDDDFRFDDEEDRRREREKWRKEAHEQRVQQALYEMKTSAKASDMKEQELLRMQMKLAYKTGDTFTAGKLAERLKPDDPNDPAKTDLPEDDW